MSLIMDVINKINHQASRAGFGVTAKPKLNPGVKENLETAFIPRPYTPSRQWARPSRLTLVGILAACFSLLVIWFATQLITGYLNFESNFSPMQLEGTRSGESFDVTSSNSIRGEVNSSWESADVLQGILFDEDNPICLIKGEVFKEGDTWNGNQIDLIMPDHVLLTSKTGRTFRLTQPR